MCEMPQGSRFNVLLGRSPRSAHVNEPDEIQYLLLRVAKLRAETNAQFIQTCFVDLEFALRMTDIAHSAPPGAIRQRA